MTHINKDDKYWIVKPLFDGKGYHIGNETIKSISSADAVPVVRCKDCRWRDAEEKHHCIDINRVFDQMDFCSFAERKDNG